MWIYELKFMAIMNQKLFPIILIFFSVMYGQPKWHIQLGTGFYQPKLGELNTALGDSSFFSNNILLDFSASYRIYYNSRIGISNWYSFHNQKDSFNRRFTYRSVFIETYFHKSEPLEFNFVIGPMWNSCHISMGIENENTNWTDLLSTFGNSGSFTFKSKAIMNKSWFGFLSSVGIRYYLQSSLGLDFRLGFIRNFYTKEKWKYEGEDINGPNIKIESLALIRLGIVFIR